MKKRWLSILLVCGMLLTTLPSAVFAEGEEPSGCVCTAACTAEAQNPECPTCGAEDAALEDCAKYEAKQENEPNDTQEPADPQEKAQEESKATEPAEDPTAPAKSQVAVRAAANNKAVAVQAAHTHCFCGGSISAGGHTSHADVAYQPWDGTSDILYTNNTAYVYLTGNATRSSHLKVIGKTLYLCLNGKTLSSNGSSKIEVKNGGHLVLCDCQGGGTFKGATQNVWGGACVYLYTSTFDMFGGKLTGGKVTKGGGGGAIAMDDQQCVFNMYGGEISDNNGNNYGGAIFRTFDPNKPNTTGGTFNMYGGTIKDNTAKNGGAFFSTTGGTVNLAGGTISGNKATMGSNDAGGGAIYMRGCGTITITGTQITGNSSSLDGGAILMGWGTVTISGNAKLTNNTASRWGGAICQRTDANRQSTINMTGGEISGNKANQEGGAVHVVDKNCTFNFSGGKITGNTSVDGGAVYLNQEPSVLNMSGGEISGNTATGNGGGVYINRTGSVCNLSGGKIENNKASGNGGGIYINPNNNGQLKLSDTPVVTGNTVSGKANNVYFPSGKKLSINGAMSSGASVGVTTANTNYPVEFSEAYGENYETLFFADDTANAHVEYNSNKELQLAAHAFTAEVAEGKYLKTEATCTVRAVYYKSCACGARSDTETFEGDFAPHNFTAEKADEQYLKSAAICTEKAVYYKSCAVCGLSSKDTTGEATFFSGNILGHDWGAWTSNGNGTHTRTCSRDKSHTETKNCHGGTATCMAKAVCEDCETEYGDLAAHHFTAEKAEEQYLKSAATCTTKAVYYKSCIACGQTSKGTAEEATFESGDVLGHDWGEPSYTWTSVADGYMCVASSKCRNCDVDVSDMATVTYAVTKAPTCLNTGIGTYTATFSGAFGFPAQTKNVTLPATGHDWGTAEYTWTSTEDGYNCTAKRVCKNDSTHVETETVTAAYAVVTEPTCLTAGLGRYQASFEADWAEDASKDVPLSALDHDWGAWTSNGNGTHTRVCARDSSHTETDDCGGGTATCTELATCVVCGGTYGQLAAHDFTAEVAEAKYLKTEATCTEQAVYYKSCKACGLASEDTFQSGNPLGHDYSTWKSNNDGTHTRICSNDSSHTENGTCSGGTATCTELATCAVCGGTYGQLAAHDFTAEVAEEDYLKSEATCTEAAVYYKSCTACGLASEDTFQSGDPLGHDYDTKWSQDETHHWHVCQRCQDIADLEEHTASGWITDKAATAKSDGEKHKECTVCGYLLETDTIPATGSKTKPGKKDNTKSSTKTRVKTNAPKTGDSSSLLLWTALLGVSGVGVTGVVLYGRKRKDNE